MCERVYAGKVGYKKLIKEPVVYQNFLITALSLIFHVINSEAVLNKRNDQIDDAGDGDYDEKKKV